MLKKVLTIVSFPSFLAIARFLPWERVPSPCVFWHLTRLPCPSCGMTRSVVALVHLDFARSVQMNWLGIPFVAALGTWWVWSVYEIRTGRRTRLLAWAWRRQSPLVAAAIAILLVYGVLRILWMLNVL